MIRRYTIECAYDDETRNFLWGEILTYSRPNWSDPIDKDNVATFFEQGVSLEQYEKHDEAGFIERVFLMQDRGFLGC